MIAIKHEIEKYYNGKIISNPRKESMQCTHINKTYLTLK